MFKHIKILDLISGGEIFLYKHIGLLLEDIKKYKFRTIIESNFAVINEQQKQILKDANVNFIVSLDGSHKELQKFLRPQCDYDTVIDNIRFFVKHKKRVTIRMTVSNYNFYDMADMLKLGEELGVDGIIFHEVQYLGCLEKPYKFDKPPEDMEYVKSIISKKYKINYDIFLSYYRRNSVFLNFIRGTYYCVIDPITAQGAGAYVKLHNLISLLTRRESCPISRQFIKVDIDGKIYFCSHHECSPVGDLTRNCLEYIMENQGYDNIRKMCSCAVSKRFICD
jgi:MoaA/NifB/PqqE/SkfB family radical SAM enzyme